MTAKSLQFSHVVIPLEDNLLISGLSSKPASDTHAGSKKVKITLPFDMVSKKREEGFKPRISANLL